MHKRSQGTVLFAGGGTGGHLAPGIAVAEWLLAHAPEVGRLFLSSDRAIDAHMLGASGESFESTAARPFGMRPGAIFQCIRGWIQTERQAARVIRAHDVRAVLALGGFVAAPVAHAAFRAGVPIVLLNLDVVPGKANRLVSRWTDAVLTTCELAEGMSPGADRVSMPLRRAVLAGEDRVSCLACLGLSPERRTVLFTGASQGAKSLNELAMALVRERRAWFDGWQVIHLTGEGRDADVRACYAESGIAARVCPFLDRMGDAWGASDLVISRAGANSVAEAWANGVPAAFFPYPFHADNHQAMNAQPMADVGGAVILHDHVDARLNLESHGETLRRLFCDRSSVDQMRSVLALHPTLNGAEQVARRLLRLF